MDDAAEGLVERVVLLREAEARERVRDVAVAEGEEGRRGNRRDAGALAELAADGEVPSIPQRQVLGRLPERELRRDADFGRVRQQEVAALGRLIFTQT